MSKGSKPRPLSVPRELYDDAWARTFGHGQNPARVTYIPQFDGIPPVRADQMWPDLTSTYLLNDDPQPSKPED